MDTTESKEDFLRKYKNCTLCKNTMNVREKRNHFRVESFVFTSFVYIFLKSLWFQWTETAMLYQKYIAIEMWNR